MSEFEKTRGAHVRFEFLKKVYTYEILRADEARGDDEQVRLHRAYAMRAYMLYLIDTVMFVDKSVTYTYVVYLRYFEDFQRIHEDNWDVVCLVYLYLKLSEGTRWKTKQITNNITLLTIIFICLLIFVSFSLIFTTPLLMIHVLQHFSGLDPLALPVHLRLVVRTNLH